MEIIKKNNIIVSVLLSIIFVPFFVLSFNIIPIDFVEALTEVAPAEQVVNEKVINGVGIAEMIENTIKDFWEMINIDYLFDILIDFFKGIWNWIQSVFETVPLE